MELVFLAIGLIAGFAIGWLLNSGKKHEQSDSISVSLYNELKVEAKSKDAEINELTASLAKAEQWDEDLNQKLKDQKTELEKLQEHFRLEFRNLSNTILEDKSRRFLEMNEQKVGEILKPLKERITAFEQKVEHSSQNTLKWNTELKEQIKSLAIANQKIANDANALALALKGDKKMQGNWGELQLELILEKAGLQDGIHYRKEVSLKDEEGSRFRPDFIINLPDGKHLVIDSKVSLVAYDQYFNAENENDQSTYLKSHIQAINNHISQLSNKNYQKLHGINSPDYIMLFVPIEPALYLALNKEAGLYEKALNANIVLVSTGTLLATLRTISYIWKQENQKRNVIEIAKESGALYDKFVGFLNDMEGIGKKLGDAQSDYDEAMKKLSTSPKKGTTIIGRIENLKELGAEASKQIDDKYLG
ncbi:MAG: DNA recombination protein RmuC [Bacteroidia bacterium]